MDNQKEEWMVQMLDEHDQFKKYQEMFKKLLTMVGAGATADELRREFGPAITARAIAMAATTDDGRLFSTLMKDLVDRTEGRAVERREVSHQFQNLTDEELNNVLASELDGLTDEQANKAIAEMESITNDEKAD
jgi:hypothetical protein